MPRRVGEHLSFIHKLGGLILTHFADLTPHTYSHVSDTDAVQNVGWLSGSEPFETGATSDAFRDVLATLVARPVILHRGFHTCDLGCDDLPFGNGQIRVLGPDGIWYSAPTLVHHYVVCHNYRPPDAFVSAVRNGIAVTVEPERIPFWPH
jgi:hypothetical protein